MPTFSTFPFEEERCIGTVCEVGPVYIKVNLPNAATADGRWLHGNRIGDGEVGEFVIAEVGDHGIFGRITNVKLPEKERRAISAPQ